MSDWLQSRLDVMVVEAQRRAPSLSAASPSAVSVLDQTMAGIRERFREHWGIGLSDPDDARVALLLLDAINSMSTALDGQVFDAGEVVVRDAQSARELASFALTASIISSQVSCHARVIGHA